MPKTTVEFVIDIQQDIKRDMAKIRKEMDRGFKSVTDSTEKANKKIKKTSASILSMKNIAIATAGVVGVKLARAFIRAGSEMETLTTQFSVLLGSTTAAKKRMEELSEFAAKTPFQLKGVATASRILETLTKGALSTGDGLRLVGDAAASTGADFDNLALHVGRAYDGLQSNRPVGESMMRLQELGLVTGDVRGEIEKLQKAGKGKEAWVVLQNQLKKTNGGMDKLSKTVPGLASTIKDQLDQALRDMMESGTWETLSDVLQTVSKRLQKMIDDDLFVKVGKGIGFITKSIASFLGLDSETNIHKVAESLRAVTESLKEEQNVLAHLMKAPETSKLNRLLGHKTKSAQIEISQKRINDLKREELELTKKLDKVSGKMFAKMGINPSGKGKLPVSAKKTKASSGSISSAPSLDTSIIDAQREIATEVSKIGASQREKELIDLGNWYDQQFRMLQEHKQSTVDLDILFNAKLADIDNQAFQEEFEKEQERQGQLTQLKQEETNRRAELEKGIRRESFNAVAAASDATFRIIQNNANRELKVKQELIRRSTLSEKDKDAKILELQKKAFKKNKLRSLAEIAIAGGVASARTWASHPYYEAIPIQIAIAANTTAQAAIVASQKFARGGDFITNGAQTITVGDNPGGRERVQVTPLSSPNFEGPQSNGISITQNLVIEGNADYASVSSAMSDGANHLLDSLNDLNDRGLIELTVN